ncbi:MAG: GNAT family N-acetyltransferase [Chitinophagaceae bacterium]|nr:GNAT family N-acetyltransferase [Chitinophagaceae bacterium]
MISTIRTNSENPDFVALVKDLDSYLAEKDGNEHSFYDQFNKIDLIRHVVLATIDGKAIGCGAIKEFSPGVMEVKRMYTLPEWRGKGVASRILEELELWAYETGADKCILETGLRQAEAIRLYEKKHYEKIPNYGQYIGVENSRCFEKNIRK